MGGKEVNDLGIRNYQSIKSNKGFELEIPTAASVGSTALLPSKLPFIKSAQLRRVIKRETEREEGKSIGSVAL